MSSGSFKVSVAVVALLLAAMPTFHAAGAIGPTAGTGEDSKITINRTVPSGNIPVEVSYTYTATYTDNPAHSKKPSITSKTASISFAGEKAAGNVSKTTVIDFSDVTYSAVGNYEFVVSETATTDKINYPVDNKTYKVVANVRLVSSSNPGGDLVVTYINKNKAQLEFSNASGEVDTGDVEIGSIIPGTRSYVEVVNKITGDMADVDKCFEYTIDMSNLPDATYSIAYPGGNNCSSVTSFEKTGASTTFKIKLKGGENAKIGLSEATNQLLLGKTVTVTQNTTDSYTTTLNGASALTASHRVMPVGNSHFESNNKYSFVNDKTAKGGATGVILNVLPFLLLFAIGIIGAIIVVNNRKSDK